MKIGRLNILDVCVTEAEKICGFEEEKYLNIKRMYGSGLQLMSKIAGIDSAKKIDTYMRFHRRLNLKTPITLADKVSYIELHDQSPLAPMCTDKYAVRDYIAKKGYADTLVPLVGGVWNSVDEIDFDALPESFVIKATHGCKMNYIVSDKNHLDAEDCKKTLQKWLNTTYGVYSMEPHYVSVPHRAYAEQYLGDMSGLIDYKIHCLNGVPKFIIAFSDRKVDEDKPMQVTLDLFDIEWNSIPETVRSNCEIPGKGNIPKPKYLTEMLKMSSDLSSDFKFVRVDLYELNDQIYFGEMTFSPACCVFPYFRDEFILKMGKYLTI